MTNIIDTYGAYLELKDAGEFDREAGLPMPIAKATVAAAGGLMVFGTLTPSVAHAGVRQGETDTHTVYIAEQGDTAWDLLGQEGVPAADRRGMYDQIIVENGKNDVSKIGIGDKIMLPKGQQVQAQVEIELDSPPMPQFVEHTVGKGQNLTRIAQQYGVSVDQILMYNGEITNRDFIKIGQNIRIPHELTQTSSAEVEVMTITIKPGQTLSEIERLTGDKVQDIAIRNGITNPDKIAAGQQIDVHNKAKQIVQEILGPEALETTKQQTKEVIIQPGQNLTTIAKEHNTTVSTLVQLNEIVNQDKIIAGEPLDVPAVEVAAAPTAPVEAPASAPEPTIETHSAAGVLPDSTAINRQWNIPTGEGTAYPNQAAVDDFKQKVEVLSAELQIDPDHLMAVISFETAGTFRTDIPNGAGSGATGLIQFMPDTAKGMGTSTEALAKMSPTEQLDYVRQYFIASAGQLETLEDVYLKVFFPAAIGKGADYALPSRVYKQNSGFDKNGDGRITVGEISTTVRDRHESAPLIEDEPASVIESIPVEIDEPVVVEKTPASEIASVEEPALEQAATPAEPEVPAVVEQLAVPVAPEHLNHPLIDWQNVVQTTDGDRNPIEVVRVNGGDHVDVRVAMDMARMIEAAKADGIELTIYSGHRSIEEQEALRAKHGCAGELMYSTTCKGKPHTALPGRSNHNSGKAVDFREGDNGRINSQSHPAFRWLKENAHKYNFQNYEPEPWHWSVDGR